MAEIKSEAAFDVVTADVVVPLWRVADGFVGHDVVVLEEASRRDRMNLAVEPEEVDTLPQVLHKEHRELRELESDQPGISLGKRPMRGLDLLDGNGVATDQEVGLCIGFYGCRVDIHKSSDTPDAATRLPTIHPRHSTTDSSYLSL